MNHNVGGGFPDAPHTNPTHSVGGGFPDAPQNNQNKTVGGGFPDAPKRIALPQRKQNRSGDFNYSGDGAYFLTICTFERKPILSTIVADEIYIKSETETRLTAYDNAFVKLKPVGKIVDSSLQYIQQNNKHISIEQFVIMPNHIHLLAYANNENVLMEARSNELIPKFISSLKRFTNKKAGVNIWQRGYYDRVIRSYQEYEFYSRYIYENPIKWKTDEYFSSL